MNENKPNVRIIGNGRILNNGNFFAAGENGVEINGVTIINTETGNAEFGNTEIGGDTTILNSGKLKSQDLKINIKIESWLSKHPWWNMFLGAVVGAIIGEIFHFIIQVIK